MRFLAGDGRDEYDFAQAKKDAAMLGIDLSELEAMLNGDKVEEEKYFDLWEDNAKHLRAFYLLAGSYEYVVGGERLVSMPPKITAIVSACDVVAIAANERESMVLDLNAMCGEYAAIANKRAGK